MTKTEKAIQIQLDQSTDTSSVTPTNEEICSGATKYYIDNYKKGLYKGLELFDEKLSNKQFEYFHKSMCYSNTFSIFAKKLQIWI